MFIAGYANTENIFYCLNISWENFDDGWDWNKILCEVFEYWVLTESK